MSQFFETGHAKNVANLLQLIQVIGTYGPSYNPGNATITLASLNTLYNTANANLTSVNNAFNSWKNATNSREIAFAGLDKLATQLLGALTSTNAAQQTISDLQHWVKKIRGDAKITKADAGR